MSLNCIFSSLFKPYGAFSVRFNTSPVGERNYPIPGTYTWIAPPFVTSVTVVAIGGGGQGRGANVNDVGGGGGGGGGLGYKNNILYLLDHLIRW